MPRVGFESKTQVFERAKTVHALDRVATVIGLQCSYTGGSSNEHTQGLSSASFHRKGYNVAPFVV
jgi:hypothetical protein